MSKRHVIALGKKAKGPPMIPYSNQYLIETLQLPKRKEKTDLLGIECFVCVISHPPSPTSTLSTEVVRNAMMAAVATPYLRGVIAMYFSEKSVVVKIVQSLENRIVRQETIGILSLIYEVLSKTPFQDVAYFEEDNATHSLAGSEFCATLLEHVEDQANQTVIVLNVHHDYVRIHHNLHQPSYAILQVMHILGKRA
jgi:hypothetical protein